MPNLYVSCIESRIDSPTNIYAQFKIGPFDKNHTLTVANNLRRTLLSELESIAIIAVKIQGVKHEYSSIQGVRECTLDILLNIKQIVLTSTYKMHVPQLAYLSVSTKNGSIRAEDIQFPGCIKCLNPKHKIATLCSDGQLNMIFLIYPGKNYWVQLGSNQFLNHCTRVFNNVTKDSFAWCKDVDHQANLLPLDAVFMPINRVNYTIETDEELDTEKPYDHIFLEIWTNGSIQPLAAIEQASRALVELFKPFQNLQIQKVQPRIFTSNYLKGANPVNKLSNSNEAIPPKYLKNPSRELYDLDIGNLNLSLRPYTCLKNANIQTIRDLLKYSAQELLLLRNFGQRSLEEVQNSLYKMGVFLPPKSKKKSI